MENLSTDTKLYYSIGEVSEMTGVEPHVLRYWESEFPTFRPRKGRAGQRAYTRKDIDMVENIKRLLYDEKFTIKGAKNKIRESSGFINTPPQAEAHVTPVQPKKEAAEETKKNQLVFGNIEKQAEQVLCDREFLVSIRSKLHKISQSLKKFY